MWVALPMHEVLQLTSSPMSPGIQDGLNLVLFFTIDDRRWACEGCAVCLRLLIWKEEIDVKDIVDLHRWGKSEFVRDWADLLRDREGSITFRGEFFVPRDREVPSFKPNLVTFLHLRPFLIVSSMLDVGQQLLSRLPRLLKKLKACFCGGRGGREVFQDHLGLGSDQKLMWGFPRGIVPPGVMSEFGDWEDLAPACRSTCCPGT